MVLPTCEPDTDNTGVGMELRIKNVTPTMGGVFWFLGNSGVAKWWGNKYDGSHFCEW